MMTAAEYTRQVQEAAAYVRSALDGRRPEIAITLGLAEYHKLAKIVSMCEKSGVHTKFIPDYNNIIPTKPYTEDLLGLPVINIRHVPLNNRLNAFMKRCVDLFGAVVALILFSPVMAVFLRTLRCVSAEAIDVAMVMPADGPSLGVAPSGTWMWMFQWSKIR